MNEKQRCDANAETLDRLNAAQPVLVDVQPAGLVVPNMSVNKILTSGAPLPWSAYRGGQRKALIYGALYEGLAQTEEEAVAKFESGEILIGACHEHGCVGSVAGIYTASMPVFVVENTAFGNRGFCNFYEGESRRRLNYGVYDDEVRVALDFLRDVAGPVIGDAVRASGGIELKPIIQRALHMGDEGHSRNTAGTLLFGRALTPHLLDLYSKHGETVKDMLGFLQQSDYFFLRLTMSSAKCTADGAHGVEGSSVMTAMTINCNDFSIRVGGLDGEWIRGPHADADVKFFEGFTEADIEWIGGESHITETVGLGGFAQAAAFPLQAYQGGSPEVMIEQNLAMYGITVGESTHYRIPYFQYRGTPTGIDIFKVAETGVAPVIDAGLAGRNGVGQIGAGTLRAPVAVFEKARDTYRDRYGI
jgi:hypothetical protein